MISEMLDSKESHLFKKCAENLHKDIHHSQILFRFDQKERSLHRASKIVRNLGVNITDITTFDFPEDSISFALFKLDVGDMREVVLALSENSYGPIKGYNAASLQMDSLENEV